MSFEHIGEIFVSVAEMLRPPERISVVQAAEKYVYLNNPGSYVGPYTNRITPYMAEPMNVFASTRYNGEIFVGPAQCGKTQSLVLNAIAYSIKIQPMDTMVVCPTMVAARDFSIRRIDRLIRYSKDLHEMLIPGGSNDNTFDKHFRNGLLLSLSWPTPTELAGKPIGRIVMTDRDRMVDDVDGDGEPYDLAAKRATTFGSYAMTLCESSPSRPVENLKWIPRTAHEAPPTAGILGLYNRGDRRRWYWPCPHCQEHFEGTFRHLVWDKPEGATNLEAAETVRMLCPHCGKKIHPDDRDEMNFWGVWVKDGQAVDKSGRVFGSEPRTMIASFWLNGVAAAFTNWKKLVALYLDAQDDFERSGSEEGLKKFYNNDLGEPYLPRNMTDIRLPETLKARAERLPELMVPDGVRFLIATIDTQLNMWRVGVYGILPGKPFDVVVIDSYDVRKSKREDADGERLWVKPNSYLEDWDQLIEHVIEKEYELADGSGRKMAVKFAGCDMHGKEGVTTMAYNFYRSLRDRNKHRRFVLLRGDSTPAAPRCRITYPDSSRKDAMAGPRGDIPVMQINANIVKDDLNGRLDCLIPGKGMIRFPDWLPDRFYSEMCSETRGPKGWENPSGHRNEDWDLLCYCLALCVSELLRVESIDWNNPPGWAAEWDKNDLVRLPEQAPRFAPKVHSAADFAALAKALA